MKINNGFSIKEENGVTIVVCDKTINRNFNANIQLTDTSIFLWKLLETGDKTKEEMLNALLGHFDISAVLALNNIDVFIRTLKENGIIE
ncbi:MAG: PqqD family protein [Clostridia bacterium]|nr:PqqD family protein [Clostridia bacterium]